MIVEESSVANQQIDIPCVGYDVKADFYEGDADIAIMIYIGFTSNKSRYKELAGLLNEQLGASVLVLDYSGHGASPFDIDDVCPAQNFLESITAFDLLKAKYPKRQMFVIGTSYGGFMATQLTKYREFDKLVLRVPALYKPHDFYTKWGEYDLIETRHDYRLNAKDLESHPLLKRAADFKGKTLVVTHELDTICPPNSTTPFIKAFQADHWVEPGLGHSFRESGVTEDEAEEYYNKIIDWLKNEKSN